MFRAGLREMWQAGRAAWPEIAVGEAIFVRYVTARDAALEHAADLYLACACAGGDARAVASFEKRYRPEVKAALAHMQLPPAVLDEVQQQLFARLFVGAEPKIADYSGRGPLASWVRVAAARTALTFKRRQRKHERGASSDDDSRLHLRSPLADPELAYMKARYRREFKAAFEQAMASLDSRDRNILRLHVLDGLNIEAIGALYRVHRATVARWIARTRDALLSETKRLLSERLRLSGRELASLMGLVQSQLEVSIGKVLEKSKG